MLWSHLISKSTQSLLISRTDSFDKNHASSIILDLCLYLVSNRDFEDVIWIRNSSSKDTDFQASLIDPSDVSLFHAQAVSITKEQSGIEDHFRNVKIRYLNTYADLKKFILNYHLLFPNNTSLALVLDDVDKFCGSHVSDNYLEIAALMLDVLSSLSQEKKSNYFIGFSLAFGAPEVSTSKLVHYFQERVEIFEGSSKDVFLLRTISHNPRNCLYEKVPNKSCEVRTSSEKSPYLFDRPLLKYRNIL